MTGTWTVFFPTFSLVSWDQQNKEYFYELILVLKNINASSYFMNITRYNLRTTFAGPEYMRDVIILLSASSCVLQRRSFSS